VTRPASQAGPLCNAISENGGQVVSFPVTEIQPIPVSVESEQILKCFEQIDMVIFISVNAVQYGASVTRLLKSNPCRTKIAAIGQATANALEALNLKVDIKPESPFNSESLLNLDCMKNVKEKNILIIKGEGGRTYLAEQLTKRSARVRFLDAYKRITPNSSAESVIKQWHDGEINVVTSFSVEALDNLSAMLGEPGKSLLNKTPHIVISKRMFDHLKNTGITAPVMIADEASDKAVVDALIRLKNTATRG